MGQPENPIEAACRQGLALHQAGRIEEAMRLYQVVLSHDAAHFEALHYLGVACIQVGQLEPAVQLIGLAIAVRPDAVAAHCDLGQALSRMGRHGEALASFDRALALNRDHPDAHGGRGQVLAALQRVEEALACYDRVVALKPDALAHFNRAVMLRELGRPAAALEAFAAAAALQPAYAEAHFGRGLVLRDLHRLDEALASLDAALALRPNHAEAHYERGAVLRELRQPEAAVASYDQALALKPDYPQAWNNRGNALTDLKRDEEALASYDRAIALRPDYAEAYSNRVIPLKMLKRPQEALASGERAVELQPGYADGYNNRGSALYEFQRLDEALASFDRALALKPDLAEAHTNRGVLLHQQRRFEEAHASFDRALALRPDDPEAHFNQAMCRLTTGDYARGWPQYEWRWGARQFEKGVRNLAAPLWLGREPLEGRVILLHGEQGLGDTLQFCRYAAPVAAMGARVVLEVQSGLERLMTRIPGVEAILVRGAPLPQTDFQTPLLSLPLALGVEPDAYNAAYLEADPADVAQWAERIGPVRGLRVGLCWAGGSRPDQPIAHMIDQRRSLTLEAFAPLAGLDGVTVFSLQKGPPAAQITALGSAWRGPPIVDLTDELKDFADTAALVANLDLMIACDTSTAHLAAGMGKPTWILNRHDSCWRWLDGRMDTPWYPAARLFTQPRPGDWDSVIAAVTGELRALAGGGARAAG